MNSDETPGFGTLLSGFGRNAVHAVKLGLGVLPTTTIQNITGLLSIAALGIFMRATPLYALAGIALVLIYLVYLNERSFRYAQKNPIPALMGGGALLQYLLRDQIGAKEPQIIDLSAEPVVGGIRDPIK